MAAAESSRRYVPQLRTALVLIGTGTAGAYHAGVLRALAEAGVKIDLVAGRGIGAVGALFAAADGGLRLSEETGLWRGGGLRALYGWRRAVRITGWLLAVVFAALTLPLLVLAGAAIVYPAGYLLALAGIEAGASAAAVYGGWIDALFAPSGAPAYLPPLVVAAVATLLGWLVIDALLGAGPLARRRPAQGSLEWRLIGTPLDRAAATSWFTGGLWKLMRGAAAVAAPGRDDMGTRYAELVTDNLGQPGFRELLLLGYDVDARRDIAFAVLAEPLRSRFVGGGNDEPDRRLEAVDATGAAGRHLMDALAGALAVPFVTDPHSFTFGRESAWRGETHRLCDRFDAIARLLDEVARAGAAQVIVVSALPSAAGPHALAADRRDIRGRIGQYLVGLETAALADAIASRRGRFAALFEVRPDHNPIGPFDFGGCYDERSDRRVALDELIDRGYEDGARQFVDAVVGASGELIETRGPPTLSERLAGHDAPARITPPSPGRPSGYPSGD